MKRLLAFSLFAVSTFGFVQEAKPLRVLFIGNSYTYYNNLPELVSGMAAASGVKIETHMVAHGGATLGQTWDIDDVFQVLHDGRWDYVVLQEHSQLGTRYVDGVQELNDPGHFWETIRMYEAEIRKVHAKTILFLTWARKVDPSQQPALNYAYMTIAQELGLTVAPVGMAWARAREAEPYMALHVADGSHPNPTGSYLAACVLADTLLGRRLSGLPARITGHPMNNRLDQLDFAHTAELVNLPQDRAEWLQRVGGEAWQKVSEAGGWIVTPKPAPLALSRLSLPPGHKPAQKELSGVWKGRMSFYTWPSTMELKLSAPDPDHCAGEWMVTSQDGGRKLAGPIDSCRLTDTGIAFLVRDYRGLAMSESYWAHYTGESLVGWVEYRGLTKSAHMSGSWELHKEH